jgi:hypothetical protein
MSDAVLEIHSSWPGTTIDGEPGIVSGILALSLGPGGSAYLSVTVGAAGAPPEDCDYVEFVLSADQADALARALSTRPS